MSRIQDILAKAERDGMTRRTQAEPVSAAVPSTPGLVMAPTRGSSALDPAIYAEPAPFLAHGAATAAESVEPRTARATLHPSLVSGIAPHSTVAERYRAIRARLAQQEGSGPLRSILVTSPAAGDGKSVTAANLALTMAQEFQRNVILVDADLRGSSVHSLFGLDSGPGLAEVLAGDVSLDEAMVYLPDYRLTILTAGATPSFPTELLGSTAMRRTVDTLRARFDRILIDVPAVAPLADTGTIAPLADAVVMVVRAGVTQRPALEEALAGFDDDKVAGVVLNDTN